jgi:SAM-dependent methyltransferase
MIDWQTWFERWEAMQNCYIPQRRYRFNLLLTLTNPFPQEDPSILDLGCGPGSLAFQALRLYPRARVLAVDADPIMLQMGRAVARNDQRIRFVQADLREPWTWQDGPYDLVVSATALHWLTREHLSRVFVHIYDALKPGGSFLNSDHISADDDALQKRYHELLEAGQRRAFRASGADDWNGYWSALAAALGRDPSQGAPDEGAIWEGSDDGHPRSYHLEALQAAGFQDVLFHWQDLGEAIVAARKPGPSGMTRSEPDAK